MNELIEKLNSVQDSYFGFVAGVVEYTKQSEERQLKVMKFMEDSDSLMTSDIIEFIMSQPDFYDSAVFADGQAV